MLVDLVNSNFQSSFLSCENDTERILRKLFIETQPHSDTLKKLLVVNTADCLSNSKYDDDVKEYSLGRLFKEGYLKTVPKLKNPENEIIKSFVILTFDNFVESSNPQFRDCTIHFDIICHTDFWNLNDYQIRPIKIAGYIDGILNNKKLTGIGKLEFVSCTQLLLDEEYSGYSLTYRAYHGSDDKIEGLGEFF